MIAAPRIGRLCVITDTTVQSRYGHDELAALSIAGGADTIQFRDKVMGDDEMIEVATRLRDVCARAGAVLVVNDRVDVALKSRAHGVHLGRGDAAIADARGLLGANAIIGGTAGNVTEALDAQAAGADYIGFGHIFPTASKNKAGAPVGLEGLAEVCAAVRIPVLAIGGITADTARACIDAGAWGVAVIAAVCAADDPRAATRRIRDQLPR